MKTKHLFFIGLVAAFSSCSTAYRTGQTTDDVYYSPAPAARENYVSSTDQRDGNVYSDQDEEQDIRRGIQDPVYRNPITLSLGLGYSPYAYNPYSYNSYGYNPYAYNYSPYSFNSYGYKGIYDPYGYDPYGYNSYVYNPYSISPYVNYYGNYNGGYYPPVSFYPGIGNINTNTGPRRVNLGAYSNVGNNSIGRTSSRGSVPVRSFTQGQGIVQPRQGTGVGNVIRRVFSPSNERYYTPPQNNRSYTNENSRSNVNVAPARTFESAPASNNSSGSSNSAPARTFRR
ncbi:MAG: hypothetical protein M3Z26_02900 [Bacteroidota bacterium]|nr:hypothetical protein [Bacteroidota bacterium]